MTQTKKESIHEIFTVAVRENNINKVTEILQDQKFNPKYNKNWALKFSTENNYIHIVELLLPYLNPKRSFVDYEAICYCCRLNNLSAIKLFFTIPHLKDIDFDISIILIMASIVKQNEVVEYLWYLGNKRDLLKESMPQKYIELTKKFLPKKIKSF